jgi:hypothetical protein
MVGILAHTVGSFLTLRGAFSTFEGTCFMIDDFIDKRVDILSNTGVLLDGAFFRITLRSKSERRTWHAYATIVGEYGKRYVEDFGVEGLDDIDWSPEGVVDATTRMSRDRAVLLGEVIDSMGTCLFAYAAGSVSWIEDPETVEIRRWLQPLLTNEERIAILNAFVLFHGLVEDKRVK